LETFTEPKELAANPHYHDQRQKSLADFSDDIIDVPIIELINAFNKLPHCFTLQSCYGHFIFNGQEDPHNVEPLPVTDDIDTVHYRIAYIAFCIDNNAAGRRLLEVLKEITVIDPENIQFCSAEWFWERQINSYALQVEPDRFKHKDMAELNFKEALYVEKIRNKFFIWLYEILKNEKER